MQVLEVVLRNQSECSQLVTHRFAVSADEDSCPYEKYNDLDSDNLCAPSDKCPNDDQNDADSDNLCGDVDVCLHDAENDADGDMLCAGKCVLGDLYSLLITYFGLTPALISCKNCDRFGSMSVRFSRPR